MKKIVKLTESDLIRIVKKCIKEQSNINEQAWLRKLVGTSVDDLLRAFGDDAVKDIEVVLQRALSKPANFVAKNGINYLKSASGKEISMDTIEKAIKLVSQGKLAVDEVATYLPSKLADGTEFRSVFQNSLKKKTVSNVAQQGSKTLGAFESKHLVNNCFSSNYCDTKNIMSSFYNKISNTAKLTRFNPSKVKVLSRSNVAGREVIETELEDGTRTLFYKSSGSNIQSTGKQSGEWFVIPGFASDGWFIKTKESISLTKGVNKYLTDMAEFLQYNGSGKLGY